MLQHRDITPEDVAFVYPLIRKVNRAPYYMLGPNPSPVVIATYSGLVCTHNGGIVGCALWSRLKTRPVVRLQYLAMLPTFQRHGGARSMLAAMEDRARADAVEELATTVIESNVPMLALVRSLGWEVGEPVQSKTKRIVRASKAVG